MESTVLASALLGYTPLIDAARDAVGVRVTVSPAGGCPLPSAEALHHVFAAVPIGVTPLVLALPDDAPPPVGLLSVMPHQDVLIELPAALLATVPGVELAMGLRRAGHHMVLRGRPLVPLPAPLLPGFRLSLVDVADDRRLNEPPSRPLPNAPARRVPWAQSGVTRIDEMARCFEAGATACVGWPWDDALAQAGGSRAANPDFSTITTLLGMIDADADPADMERVLKRDASLAYRLLRYMNAAAFGLRVEVTSFRHAIMMLGHQKLRRWLALLLATASKEADLRPVMFASFRRGIFLEQLIGAQDPSLRDQAFILGVFSLLDRLFRTPFERLFETMHVPDAIRETLAARTGPHLPYLQVVEAVERGPASLLQERLDTAFVSPEQANRALLASLAMPDLARMPG